MFFHSTSVDICGNQTLETYHDLPSVKHASELLLYGLVLDLKAGLLLRLLILCLLKCTNFAALTLAFRNSDDQLFAIVQRGCLFEFSFGSLVLHFYSH